MTSELNGYKFVNLTSDDVRVVDENDSVILHVPAAARAARAFQELRENARVAGIPLMRVRYGMIDNLPEPENKTLYIVTAIIAQAAQAAGRPVYDLVIPDDGADCVRLDGKVWAVRRFLTV